MHPRRAWQRKFTAPHILNTGFYDPTCTLIIRVESVEAATHEYRVVGYALLNIFVDARDVKRQPTESTHQVRMVAGTCHHKYRRCSAYDQRKILTTTVLCLILLDRTFY